MPLGVFRDNVAHSNVRYGFSKYTATRSSLAQKTRLQEPTQMDMIPLQRPHFKIRKPTRTGGPEFSFTTVETLGCKEVS